jgi:hypothetical protein
MIAFGVGRLRLGKRETKLDDQRHLAVAALVASRLDLSADPERTPRAISQPSCPRIGASTNSCLGEPASSFAVAAAITTSAFTRALPTRR